MKTRWQVEWCSKMRFDDCGDMQPDLAEYTTRNFPNKGLAGFFALKITPHDYFGCVHVHEQLFDYKYANDTLKTWQTIDSYELSPDNNRLCKYT